jgi:hypothetical protein
MAPNGFNSTPSVLIYNSFHYLCQVFYSKIFIIIVNFYCDIVYYIIYY